jgi:(p)ppGpp synthase/HD superfamily hydrolase
MIYSYRVEQAIRAATILHKDQVRKGSAPLPYISHVFATAFIVSDYTDDEDTVIAALLHDTIEDTDYTADEIFEDFGGRIRELVLTLTEPVSNSGEPLSWKERKDIYLKQIKQGDPAARLVATADKMHNFRSIVEEYYDDHGRFLADFGGSIDKRIAHYDQFHATLNEFTDNPALDEFNHVFSEFKQFIHAVKKSSQFEG